MPKGKIVCGHQIRISALVIMVLMSCIPMIAQNKIESFYGLKLGMTKSQVSSALSRQSITYKRESDSSKDYFLVSRPRLGNSTFQRLVLHFNNGILCRGVFVSDESAGGYPEAPGFTTVQNSAGTFKSIFNQMYVNFCSKYGDPQVSDENEYIWIKGNKLTLEYLSEDYYDGPYMRQARTMVRVQYELNNNNSSNY